MNKKIIIIIAVAAAVAIAVGGAFAAMNIRRLFQPMDGPDMVYDGYITYIYYIKGGAKNGEYDEIHAKLDEETDTVNITVESRENWEHEKTYKEVTVDREIFTEIGRIMTENNLKAASRHRQSKDVVLDGASYDITIELHSGEEIRIMSTQKLSQEEHEAIMEIVNMLKNAE